MTTVFANGLAISGKATDSKTIAAFPDVCFTPPENPATPPGVPIPYPSFGMASDTESGTGTVFIGGKTVNIKNKSDESKTSGTEAGCAAKKGIVSSKNTGKKYFNSWSPDVKFDGEPVIRFTDLATHNHASPAANAPPWLEADLANVPPNPDGSKCIVGRYGDKQPDCAAQEAATGKPHQFHHIVPDRSYRKGRRRVRGRKTPKDVRQRGAPTHAEGMCICLPAENHVPSKKSKKGTIAVHADLDDKLTALGQNSDTPSSPAGCASLSDVRKQSIASLAKLVPKTITQECFELAVRAINYQTRGRSKRQVRAEKSLKAFNQDARRAM